MTFKWIPLLLAHVYTGLNFYQWHIKHPRSDTCIFLNENIANHCTQFSFSKHCTFVRAGSYEGLWRQDKSHTWCRVLGLIDILCITFPGSWMCTICIHPLYGNKTKTYFSMHALVPHLHNKVRPKTDFDCESIVLIHQSHFDPYYNSSLFHQYVLLSSA